LDGAVVIPAVAPSATLSSVLTCVAVSSSALPAPLDTLPKILLFATSSNLSKVTALSSILADANVPDEMLSAFSAVRFAPLVARNVAEIYHLGLFLNQVHLHLVL